MDGEMRSYSLIALPILLGCPLVMTPTAEAQKTAEVSASQSATTEELPNWLSFDLELRSRTEGQTAINFLPGVSPVYDLGRLCRFARTNWILHAAASTFTALTQRSPL